MIFRVPVINGLIMFLDITNCWIGSSPCSSRNISTLGEIPILFPLNEFTVERIREIILYISKRYNNDINNINVKRMYILFCVKKSDKKS
jgi:hypothetical protein